MTKPLNGRAFRQHSHDFVRRIDDICAQRRQRKIYFAKDAHGRAHAAVYVVFDTLAAYYLMVGSDPDLRQSGAVSLCTWEAIRGARETSNRFDFEGSMMRKVEPYVVILALNKDHTSMSESYRDDLRLVRLVVISSQRLKAKSPEAPSAHSDHPIPSNLSCRRFFASFSFSSLRNQGQDRIVEHQH